MPLPAPHSGESHDDFVGRCMANDTMNSEYPDNDQRYAVCQSLWDDRTAVEQLERRVLPPEGVELRVERRADGTPEKLTGYAAVFGKWSEDLGFFREQIAPGAFRNCLAASDVRALVNHNSDMLLGRTRSGTLRLKEDDKGLHFTVDLPNTTAARDVAESIERGDISGCSFAFTVKQDEWVYVEDGARDERTLVEIGELFDVGPVTYPAYPDTTVAARSHEAFRRCMAEAEQARAKAAEPPVPEGSVEKARRRMKMAQDAARKRRMELKLRQAQRKYE